MTRLWLSALAALALSACTIAPTQQEATNQIAAAPVCCKELSELPFEAITFPSTTEFHIDTASPAFEFFSGKSFFKAFALPQAGEPYTIMLRSYLVTTMGLQQMVFYPVVAFLSEKHEISYFMRPADFRFRDSTLWSEPMDPPKVEARIRIDPTRDQPRYMVVFTDLQTLKPGRSMNQRGSMTMVPAGNTFIPIVAPGGMRTFGASGTGRLRVFIEPLPAPK
jgi:maltose operon periplasmic protein